MLYPLCLYYDFDKVIIDWNHLCYGFLESRELYHNHNIDTKNITTIMLIRVQ